MTDARLSAAKDGAWTYQGRPCKHGHKGIRYTSNGQCKDCVREANKAYAANIKKLLAESKE
jgi:hypothetical protein